MTGPVCYVERTGSGTLIRGLRLVGDRLDRAWSPPVTPEGLAADPAAAVEQTRAAARWVAAQLPKNVRSLSSVCVDVDGGLCLWLSAPSDNPAVVAAAMLQGRGADDHGPGDGVTGGGGGLLALASAGVGMERSVQALAGAGAGKNGNGHAGGAKPGLLASSRGLKLDSQRRRMAVLSVPDLTVRVFLDELDALGVEVEAVATLWHAMAAAWNPDRGRAGGGSSSSEARFAASVSPCSAVVVLDPASGEAAEGGSVSGGSGGGGGGGGARLIWAWSDGDELVAGGAMRLRSIAAPASTPASAAESALEGARRVESAAPEERMTVCAGAEAGRLIADWLAWSAQLGVSPTRVICVGPMPVSDDDGPGFVELLARGWHGASVDAAVHPDPIGATLERYGGPGDHGGEPATDPRAAMVELSHRPGRAHRRMYRWGAAAITVAAVAAGALGWRLSSAAEDARAAAKKLRDDTHASLAGLETIAPNLATEVGRIDPVGVLRSSLAGMRQSRPSLDYDEPILAEFGRLLGAIDSPDINAEVKLDEVQFGKFSISARLLLAENDAVTGPEITAKLRETPGQIQWSGVSGPRASGQSKRTWNLSGMWLPGSAKAPGTFAKGDRP